MALAIDTRHLVERWMPRLEDLLSSANFEKNRYQVQAVYACATVLSHDVEATVEQISTDTPCLVKQEALDWQADQGVLTEGAVWHHLTHMGAASSSMRPHAPLKTLFASAFSPEFADDQCEPHEDQQSAASLYYRHSFRLSSLEVYNAALCVSGYHIGATDLQKLDVTTVEKVPSEWWESYLFDAGPEIIWKRNLQSAVIWNVQVDIIDLHCTPSLTPIIKRRRRRYGEFQQVSPGGGEETSSSQVDPISAAKRYNGVRYRADRKRYIAEMRPRGMGCKNKDSFGGFKSPAEAARAVDAAFHYFGLRDKLNFADTPDILATKPIPAGLDQADTLRFVKVQAKWLASLPSMATLPSSPSVCLETNPEPSRGCTTVPPLGFSPFPDISSSLLISCGGAGGADNGVSQLQLSSSENTMDAMGGNLVATGWVENTLDQPFVNVVATDYAVGVTMNELCEIIGQNNAGRSVVQVPRISEENAIVDDPSDSGSSGRITDQLWDGAEYRIWDALKSPGVEQPCDQFQSVVMDLILVSPPEPNLFQMESPHGFQGEVADGLLQQQIYFEEGSKEHELLTFQ